VYPHLEIHEEESAFKHNNVTFLCAKMSHQVQQIEHQETIEQNNCQLEIEELKQAINFKNDEQAKKTRADFLPFPV
jgi:hypothetical protein